MNPEKGSNAGKGAETNKRKWSWGERARRVGKNWG